MSNEDDKWVGEWFVPVKGARYYLPANAGNYQPRRGWHGVCMDYEVSPLGHVWAKIKFDENEEHGVVIEMIRTKYLKPENDDERLTRPVRKPIEDNREDALKKAAAVWGTEDNSGTETITGQE
jgi:hypothetical protein